MQSFACKDTKVEKCPACNGIWFRRGGFAIFRNALQEFDLAKLKMLPRSDQEAVESIPACPDCGEALSSFRYAYNSKVVLQKCQPCGGVWLPFSELLDLVELTGIGQAIAPHLRAAAGELAKMDAERKRDRTVIQFLLDLVKPVSPWGWWG